jgi:hypothetical protein
LVIAEGKVARLIRDGAPNWTKNWKKVVQKDGGKK